MAQKNTKDLILDAALDLFSEKGFAATSIREIAEKVGIRKSSIYNHFKSKEDIFETLFSILGAKTIKGIFENKELQEKINHPYDFLKIFAKLVKKFVDNLEEEKLLKVMLMEHNSEVVRRMMKEKFLEEDREILIKIFKEMIEKGLIKPYDPLTLANEFIGTLIFIRIQHLLLSYETDDFSVIYNLIDRHIEFFWNAIKVED
ncbi:hypothetical protein U472_07430 [Orenia metallireducens]|uniref:HTH tetR-type domain-containing protein n=1 Tax=Orenia metallireducens TaxID=1413210 RepID=A0A1C0AAG4_9FIRM|nr:TetR/AcrR family transcriptional regulator [Orenia metallireducens]OCL27288.1 hypothetical protein U472_07430 [Orenia metallireducens]